MALTEQQKHKLKKFIKDLSSHKGRHTSLVSVYIPKDYDIIKIIQHLSQESGTATNIKDATTRKNVIDALERMIQHLRLFKKTPPNGLAVFSGNVASQVGKQDFEVWSVEPPVPLKTRIYKCDKTFVVDLLEDMLEIKEVYGLIVMDRRDADIAYLKGKTIIPLRKTHSEVPGKIKAGGQCVDPGTLILGEGCQSPIGETQKGNWVMTYDFKTGILRNTRIIDFWKVKKDKLLTIKTDKSKVKCSQDHLFFVEKDSKVEEVAAENLKEGDVLFYMNKSNKETTIIEKIIVEEGNFELIDISVKNGNFIANGLIVHNSAKRYAKNTELAAKQHYKKVADHVKEQFLGNKNLKGIIVGGPGPTKYDFVEGGFITNELKKKVIGIKDLGYTGDFGLQELVDKSEDVLAKESIMDEKKAMGTFFDLLAKKPGKVSYGEKEVMQNLKNGVVDVLLLSEELDEKKIENFEKAASLVGTTVKLISTETREGVQLRDIGKVAAVLRYEVQ